MIVVCVFMKSSILLKSFSFIPTFSLVAMSRCGVVNLCVFIVVVIASSSIQIKGVGWVLRSLVIASSLL